MSQKRKKIAIGTFLVLGTFIVLNVAADMAINYSTYRTLALRTGILKYFIIFDFLTILPFLTMVSTISYFTKGYIWKPLTKAMIVNIFIWFAYLIFICIQQIPELFECIAIIFILLVSWGLVCLWKAINSMN